MVSGCWDSQAGINIMKCFSIITIWNKMHWCVSMATHWIYMLLAATYIGLQYKHNIECPCEQCLAQQQYRKSFKWNDVRLSGYLRRFKHYTYIPQYYFIPTFPILLCMAWHFCVCLHLFIKSCNYHLVGVGHAACQSMCSYFFPCFINYEAEFFLGSFITTQLDKKWSFYEYCLFVAVFTGVHQWSVFWHSWIHRVSLCPFF